MSEKLSERCEHCDKERWEHCWQPMYHHLLGACRVYRDGNFVDWHPTNRFTPARDGREGQDAEDAKAKTNGWRESWHALIQGGEGPDVWDREVELSAVDFMDAAKQAEGKAEYYGGYVVSLERTIYE